MNRQATLKDAARIAEIVNWYIENTVISFEQVAVSVAEMPVRIKTASELHPWYVFEQKGVVCGYAFAADFKSRGAYSQTVETTIYVDKDELGRGIGKSLYLHLINQLKLTSANVLVATIALPNAQSIALHEKLGYIKCGHLSEVGLKFENWVDVGYWQLILKNE